jgi:hypothetical protein
MPRQLALARIRQDLIGIIEAKTRDRQYDSLSASSSYPAKTSFGDMSFGAKHIDIPLQVADLLVGVAIVKRVSIASNLRAAGIEIRFSRADIRVRRVVSVVCASESRQRLSVANKNARGPWTFLARAEPHHTAAAA